MFVDVHERLLSSLAANRRQVSSPNFEFAKPRFGEPGELLGHVCYTALICYLSMYKCRVYCERKPGTHILMDEGGGMGRVL